jgi:hypothetical protein
MRLDAGRPIRWPTTGQIRLAPRGGLVTPKLGKN